MPNYEKNIENAITWFSQIKEKILWHYTQTDILGEFVQENSVIYATHSSELNDSNELAYGRKIWDNVLEEKGYFSKDNKHIYDAIENSECVNRLKNNTFIFSLTRKSDMVCHWKTYCPNGGVAIGFNTEKLMNKLRDFANEQYSRKSHMSYHVTYLRTSEVNYRVHADYCEYEPERTKKNLCSFVSRLKIDKEDEILYFLKLCFFRENIIYNIKHPSFATEDEVRIIFSGPELMRESKLIGKKHRIALFQSSDLIEKVLISPHGNKESSFRYANFLKERYGLQYEIIKSDSPFRD